MEQNGYGMKERRGYFVNKKNNKKREDQRKKKRMIEDKNNNSEKERKDHIHILAWNIAGLRSDEEAWEYIKKSGSGKN